MAAGPVFTLETLTQTATTQSRARVGSLRTSHGTVCTPSPLFYTRRGALPFITQELAVGLGPAGECPAFAVPIPDFVISPKPETLTALGGGHSFMRCEPHVVYGCLRDPSYSNTEGPASKEYVTVQASTGRKTVTAKQYMELANALNFDFTSVLCQEVPPTSGGNRSKKSYERTLPFLDACLAERAEGVAVFGTILGGPRKDWRAACAAAVAERDVCGFVLGGFGLGEEPVDRSELISVVVNNLPEDKPRVIQGLSNPDEILDAVDQGIDLFDCVLPYTCTTQGVALTFACSEDEFDAGATDYSLHLRDRGYVTDDAPLLSGCACFTCQSHSRAYINHLLITHELLGATLLMIHNTHHMMRFFGSIRDSVRESRFDEYKGWFERCWVSGEAATAAGGGGDE